MNTTVLWSKYRIQSGHGRKSFCRIFPIYDLPNGALSKKSTIKIGLDSLAARGRLPTLSHFLSPWHIEQLVSHLSSSGQLNFLSHWRVKILTNVYDPSSTHDHSSWPNFGLQTWAVQILHTFLLVFEWGIHLLPQTNLWWHEHQSGLRQVSLQVLFSPNHQPRHVYYLQDGK